MLYYSLQITYNQYLLKNLKFISKIDVNNLLDGGKVTLNIYEDDKSGTSEQEANSCLLTFTMKTGEKFLIYEHGGKLCAEEKKFFYDWKTKSGFDVNPHSNMKRNTKACRFCPF